MAVRRLFLYTLLVTCLKLGVPAWAGTFDCASPPAGALCFHGISPPSQGLLSFTPVVGTGVLTIGAGNGANGGLITDVLGIVPPVCGGDCTVLNGYLTLTSGTEQSGIGIGNGVLYTFNAGGIVRIVGGIPVLGIPSGSTLFTATFIAGDTFMV